MEVQELRIGNYIDYSTKGSICEIVGIDRFSIIESFNIKEKGYNPPRHIVVFYPIELTDEWLLKFGFELYTEKKGISAPVDIAKKHPLWLRLLANEWTIFIKEGSGAFKSIKYVHQLQNIYFALTGSELSV